MLAVRPNEPRAGSGDRSHDPQARRVAVDPARRARSAGTGALVGQLSRPSVGQTTQASSSSRSSIVGRSRSIRRRIASARSSSSTSSTGRAAASTPLVNTPAPSRSMAGGSRIETRVLLTQVGQFGQLPSRFNGIVLQRRRRRETAQTFLNPARHGKIQTRAGVHAVHTLRSAAEVLPLTRLPSRGRRPMSSDRATPALQFLTGYRS